MSGPSREAFYRSAGKRLAALRKSLAMDSDSFAAALGISRRSLKAFEAGERTRGWNRILLPLSGLGVSLDWVLDGRLGNMGRRDDKCPLRPNGQPLRRAA